MKTIDKILKYYLVFIIILLLVILFSIGHFHIHGNALKKINKLENAKIFLELKIYSIKQHIWDMHSNFSGSYSKEKIREDLYDLEKILYSDRISAE